MRRALMVIACAAALSSAAPAAASVDEFELFDPCAYHLGVTQFGAWGGPLADPRDAPRSRPTSAASAAPCTSSWPSRRRNRRASNATRTTSDEHLPPRLRRPPAGRPPARRGSARPRSADRALSPACAGLRAALPPLERAAGRPDSGRLRRAGQGGRPLGAGAGPRVLQLRGPDRPGASCHHLRDLSWAVRPPRDLQELSQSIERERAAIGRERWRAISPSASAARARRSPKRCTPTTGARRPRSIARSPTSPRSASTSAPTMPATSTWTPTWRSSSTSPAWTAGPARSCACASSRTCSRTRSPGAWASRRCTCRGRSAPRWSS